MRILHLGKFFPPFAGGMENFLADLLSALHQQGAQVAGLVHNHHKQLFGHKALTPLPAGNSDLVIYRAPCYGRLLYSPISPSFPLWLARAVHEFKPHILHLHMPNTSAFWAMLVPSARRIPWLLHWHSDVVASQLDRRLALAYRAYRPLEQRLLAASRAVIATSPSYLASSAALRPWRDKCHVIPLGLDPERIPEPRPTALSQAELLWGNAPYRVLAVGRLTYYKGYEILIRAVAGIPDLRLLIVGDGDRRPHLKALINTLNLEQKILLPGFQSEDQLYALLATCDVFCLPSVERTEAFGLVLLEAMRFRKPVVASDIPGSGVGWVVERAENGLLVRPGDVDALTQALTQLAGSPRQRRTYGQQGALSLQQTFHIKQVAEQTMAVYEAVYRQRR